MIERFKCSECGFEFPAMENYKTHLLVTHPNGELAKSIRRQLARTDTRPLARTEKTKRGTSK